MTTVAASQVPKLQFFNPSTGVPLAGGLLFTYAAGTTTKQVTYSNPDNLTPNTNPVVLDSTGSCVCFLDATLQYEFTLSPPGDTDPPTNPIYSVDQVGYADILQGYAPLASPAFTGNPTAPTPTAGDNSTSIATTQFVDQAITAGQNNSNLIGTPTAPTAAAGTYTTQIATTAFVGNEINKAGQMAVFANSGTWNIPTNVKWAKFRIWGAGGGGGGGNAGGNPGSGGGGGGYSEGWISLGANTSLAIVIGSGGGGGAAGNAGTAGGSSTIAALGVTVAGGAGGAGSGGTPGAGGSASGLTLNWTGGSGGISENETAGIPGWGGSAWGGGRMTGAGPGAGGDGRGGGTGGVSAPGDSGMAGLCIIEWLAP